MEELDYKDLFRDAVLMMAEFARAAGFDPRDEGVEPPDVAARVENMRTRLADLEDDFRRTIAENCAPDERHCSCVPHLRRALREAEKERDEAQAQRAAIMEECAQAATEIAAAANRALAEAQELRLTLAAEQGRPEGAPYDNPEMVLAMSNGERIRRGLSWRELAAILDVSPSTLTRWTHGKMLSVPAYLRVCKWLSAAISETTDIARAGAPGWCDRCSPDRCDCEDDGAAMIAADDAFAKIERLAQTSQYPSPAQAVRPG